MAEGKKMKRRWPGDKLMDYVLVVVFIGIIFITVYPFLNVLAISLNDPMDTMRNVNFIIPREMSGQNWRLTCSITGLQNTSALTRQL